MSPEACRRWLQSLNITLWPAVAFDLQDDKEIVLAGRWLSETINEAWGQTSKGVSDSESEPGWVYQGVYDG